MYDIPAECDRLRETLEDCECGSRELYWQHWRLGMGACVVCRSCGLGSPSKQKGELIVNLPGDCLDASLERATVAARDAWNAYRQASNAI